MVSEKREPGLCFVHLRYCFFSNGDRTAFVLHAHMVRAEAVPDPSIGSGFYHPPWEVVEWTDFIH